MTADELRAFETRVAEAFERGDIRAPVHLSGGNEEQLIEFFRGCVGPADWVFSNWRNHFHALLHGVPEERLMSELISGHTMNLILPEYRFFTSAIVGGCLPIALGMAAGIKRRGGDERVWVFVGDMTASIGAFQDAVKYAWGQDLPIRFIVEDNGLSTNTPTVETWGVSYIPNLPKVTRYSYERIYPHYGIGKTGGF